MKSRHLVSGHSKLRERARGMNHSDGSICSFYGSLLGCTAVRWFVGKLCTGRERLYDKASTMELIEAFMTKWFDKIKLSEVEAHVRYTDNRHNEVILLRCQFNKDFERRKGPNRRPVITRNPPLVHPTDMVRTLVSQRRPQSTSCKQLEEIGRCELAWVASQLDRRSVLFTKSGVGGPFGMDCYWEKTAPKGARGRRLRFKKSTGVGVHLNRREPSRRASL